MKKLFYIVIVLAIGISMLPSVVFAAKSNSSTTGSSFSGASEQVGYDISYPQCGKRLPTDQYFGIVGVNGGNAATTNPCLADQLTWAGKSRSGSTQPKVQLYVNTANPGEVISQITTWPTNNIDKTGFVTDNPYGICSGANDKACSWQYGWNRSVDAYTNRFVPAASKAGIDQTVSAYVWWLDVETMNTWQSGSAEALTRNLAALEGFAKYYQSNGAKVGLYSTAVQWAQINGNTIGLSGNLNGLGNWRPSGSTLTNAINNCKAQPLTTGGYISLTQYVQQNIDKNHSCI